VSVIALIATIDFGREVQSVSSDKLMRCAVWLSLLFPTLVLTTIAQSSSPPSVSNGTSPESGFVSKSKYTNAFFGFFLPLPRDLAFDDFRMSFNGETCHYFLFGFKTYTTNPIGPLKPKLTVFYVTAEKSTELEALRRAAGGPKEANPTKIEIGGREFWTSEVEEKVPAGTEHHLAFSTAAQGYILQFSVESFDKKMAAKLRESISHIEFFDPVKTQDIAGPDRKSYVSAVAGVPCPAHIEQLGLGAVSGTTYTNDTLGLSFQFPAGWVVADKATQEKVREAGHQLAYGNDPAAAREHAVTAECSRTLLLATRYPEGTKTDEVNPMVAIMAYDSGCLPGMHMPTSTHDSDAIRQLGAEMTKSLSGTPFVGNGQNTIRGYTRQNRMLLDLSSGFKANVPGSAQPRDVFTSAVFTEVDGYWLTWLFMNGSQSGLDELKRSIKMSFRSADGASPHD
jgi:hypothetical protein